MPDTKRRSVVLLDDDLSLHKVVTRILDGVGISVTCFADPAKCIAKLRSQQIGLLITDLRMPGTDGIEVLKEVKRFAPWLSVLVISGYGDIPTAVYAVKSGAVDFLEKPLDKATLVDKVRSMLVDIDPTDKYVGMPLTQAEMTVLRLVIEGKSSKEIARLLHRSVRTVEGHRGQLMRKLHAEDILDLVERAVSMELIDVNKKPQLRQAAELLRVVRT